jgi:hypothetical protein
MVFLNIAIVFERSCPIAKDATIPQNGSQTHCNVGYHLAEMKKSHISTTTVRLLAELPPSN